MDSTLILPVAIALLTIIALSLLKKKAVPQANEAEDRSQVLPGTEPTDLATEEWRRKFMQVGLHHQWERYKKMLRKEIRIFPDAMTESSIRIGESKIGGQPDLPSGQSWFREENGACLSFLAQINLNETALHDESHQLPATGMLYFFYSAEQDAWGFDPNDKDKFKVFYFDGDTTALIRTDFPPDLPEHGIFKSCRVNFGAGASMPDWEHDEVRLFLSDKEQDAYLQLTAEGSVTKLLGHSDNIQGPMEEECQLVTHNIYRGDTYSQHNTQTNELKNEANQWTLLFQIDSIDQAGMMWGDVGRVYFWIKKEDLASKEFNKCWFVLQCS